MDNLNEPIVLDGDKAQSFVLALEVSQLEQENKELKNKIKKMQPVYDRCMDCQIVCVKDDYLQTKDENDELKELIRLAVENIKWSCKTCKHSNSNCKCSVGGYEPSAFMDCAKWKWKHTDRMERVMGGRKSE